MVFKCKMCDAILSIQEGDSVAVCEYCGSAQSLPRFSDEKMLNLFERAGHYRSNNEFDKAQALYEEILESGIKDPDIYWSVILCKYGVEYVEEEDGNKRVPTVNRTQTVSVLDDENYAKALEYADEKQRKVYEEEAKRIDDIQKEILAISGKEEPFDIFICYKESDEHGRRTLDSVLAMELYEKLGEEGYKVFYARITLDDKFGEAYEPYIYAALNSSKVMIAVGTKPEHFQAAWVKNEWSRYLGMIKNGAKKTLIPAYKDMDPYEMPMEFAHLQAINMGELGFWQDVIHGIRKFFEEDGEKKNTSGISVRSLLDRGFICMEDGEWDTAEECMAKALQMNARNGEIYLGKLMIDLKMKKREDLAKSQVLFDSNENYRRIMRYGDDELKQFVNSALEEVHNNAGSDIYESTVKRYQNAIQSEVLLECAEIFDKLGDYRDSVQMAENCRRRAMEAEERQKEDRYKFYLGMADSDDKEQLQKALEYFKSVNGYKDATTVADRINKKVLALEQAEEMAFANSSRKNMQQYGGPLAEHALESLEKGLERRRKQKEIETIVYMVIFALGGVIWLLMWLFS